MLLCKKPSSSIQTTQRNFLSFSSEIGGDEIDYNRKICYTIRFFDVIPQSLNLRLFATHKLLKRPLPSKRHREISHFLCVRRDPNVEIDHKTKQNKTKQNKKTNKQYTTKQKNKQTKQTNKQNKTKTTDINKKMVLPIDFLI